MTAEKRCEMSDLPVSMCAHCQGHTDEPDKVEAIGVAFPAIYPGWCVAECGKRIEVDDLIIRSADGGYAHARCAL